MPRLACRTCGRRIYTVAPLEALFAEERLCPRCGAKLGADRRVEDRRSQMRRSTAPDSSAAPEGSGEQRTADRRTKRRRKPMDGESRREDDPGGWQD